MGFKSYSAHCYFVKYVLLFFFVLGCFFQLRGQDNERVSLRAELTKLTQEKDFSKKDTVYLKTLNELADSYRYHDLDSVLHFAKLAIASSKEAGSDKGEIYGLINLGNYYSDFGNTTKAISTYKKAVDLSKSTGHEMGVMKAQHLLGAEYSFHRNYADALTNFLEAIERAEKVEDYLMLSIVNEEIANLYSYQKDYDQALEYYKKVKKFNEKLDDEIMKAETASNMASLYIDMNELDYAMFNANSSIAIFEKHRIQDWLAYAYQIKGKTYLKKKNYKWAMFWFDQSALIHEKIDDERIEVDLLNGIAEVQLELGKNALAQQYALSALALSKKIKKQKGTQEAAKTLYKINRRQENYESALEYHEVFKRISDSTSVQESQKSLTLLKANTKHEEQKQLLILENDKQLAKQRNYMNAALAVLLLFIAILFLIKRNEKTQKRLNEELRVKTEGLMLHEKELEEINKTKDKLFSIVAHDLRGPIGSFQGLLNMFKQGDIEKDEFIAFIPKLGNDIDHISFTLNNLLTWGQKQMNGLITKPEIVSLDRLVDENINLLSETAINKSIKLVSNLPRNIMAWTDGNQIDIVIRNLISNAIKFTPTNGMVSVMSREKNKHWEISVKDTGIGMNAETLKSVFSENSNHSTYGTNNEKGTGLGLSLCKEMVEKNNGDIWADSIINQGTTFYFTVPKAKLKKRFKQTA